MSESPATTKQKIDEIAKAYIDKQLASMQKNGLKAKELSTEEYQSLVNQIAAAVRA